MKQFTETAEEAAYREALYYARVMETWHPDYPKAQAHVRTAHAALLRSKAEKQYALAEMED